MSPLRHGIDDAENVRGALSTLVELVRVALLLPLMILLLGRPVALLIRLLLEIASRLSRLVEGLLWHRSKRVEREGVRATVRVDFQQIKT